MNLFIEYSTNIKWFVNILNGSCVKGFTVCMMTLYESMLIQNTTEIALGKTDTLFPLIPLINLFSCNSLTYTLSN